MQIWALLVDSYRLLMSRKLFWITLVISALVVLMYASIGFDETGCYLFFGLTHFESDIFRSGSEWASHLYLGIFSTVIVGWWFTWAAAILALVSTSPIFNDFMADGSIDLVLSKPMGRIRIFLVKYLGGLLFVLLQMTVITFGVFLCVGWRVGEWKPEILLAIPLVLVFFSYLYSVSVLLTMLTRSTIASLMLTFVFWFVIWGVNFAEQFVNQQFLRQKQTAELIEKYPDSFSPQARVETDRAAAAGGQNPVSKESISPAEAEEIKEAAQRDRKAKENRLNATKKSAIDSAADLKWWRDGLRSVLAVLPKTKQTTDLVERWTVESGQSLTSIMMGAGQRDQNPNQNRRSGMAQQNELQRKLEDDYRNRSAWYVIGTSLAFEFVMLAFACFIFVRRDF